jgi:F-type H+-transporting ATPase subunit epsilon
MLEVHVLTPEEQLFEGPAKSVTLPGAGGQFQVLNNHAPIVAALNKGAVVIASDSGEKQSYQINSGFIEVLNNTVNILVQSTEE